MIIHSEAIKLRISFKLLTHASFLNVPHDIEIDLESESQRAKRLKRNDFLHTKCEECIITPTMLLDLTYRNGFFPSYVGGEERQSTGCPERMHTILKSTWLKNSKDQISMSSNDFVMSLMKRPWKKCRIFEPGTIQNTTFVLEF